MVIPNCPSLPRPCRPKRLHSQRGAAVFIVVMVLTLLTAVGIFAVRSASLANVASGYDREAAQASLVAEYATTATAAYMATNGANTVLDGLKKPNLYCQSNTNTINLALPCVKVPASQIEGTTLTAGSENLFETSSPSLNANGATDADFVVELTDPGGPGGLGVGDPHTPLQVTVTAIAQVRQAGVCQNGVGTTWNAGQQVTRSFITASNVNQ